MQLGSADQFLGTVSRCSKAVTEPVFALLTSIAFWVNETICS